MVLMEHVNVACKMGLSVSMTIQTMIYRNMPMFMMRIMYLMKTLAETSKLFLLVHCCNEALS